MVWLEAEPGFFIHAVSRLARSFARHLVAHHYSLLRRSSCLGHLVTLAASLQPRIRATSPSTPRHLSKTPRSSPPSHSPTATTVSSTAAYKERRREEDEKR